jgi:hypothetical protein
MIVRTPTSFGASAAILVENQSMRPARASLLLTTLVATVTVSGQVRPATTPAPSCDRTCLEAFVDRYLEALVAHDAFSLPLAPSVVVSENTQRLPIGDGLWNTATGLGEYKLYVSDPDAGQVGFFGTVLENGGPVGLTLRLKIDNRRISEIETLVVRDADAAKAIDAMEPQPTFLEGVPSPTATSTPSTAARRRSVPIATASRTARRPPTTRRSRSQG